MNRLERLVAKKERVEGLDEIWRIVLADRTYGFNRMLNSLTKLKTKTPVVCF